MAAVYFGWCAFDPYQWHFIDGVNLLIHEAGHIIFMPFGEFISIAGGSLFQLIVQRCSRHTSFGGDSFIPPLWFSSGLARAC